MTSLEEQDVNTDSYHMPVVQHETPTVNAEKNSSLQAPVYTTFINKLRHLSVLGPHIKSITKTIIHISF